MVFSVSGHSHIHHGVCGTCPIFPISSFFDRRNHFSLFLFLRSLQSYYLTGGLSCELDKIIFGAGLYGLYAALQCGQRGEKILVLDGDPAPFMRATYINQARVHMGYHYPRSFSTAIKSAHYFERFHHDYEFCELTSFDQIYSHQRPIQLDECGGIPSVLPRCKDPLRGSAPRALFQSGPLRRRLSHPGIYL